MTRVITLRNTRHYRVMIRKIIAVLLSEEVAYERIGIHTDRNVPRTRSLIELVDPDMPFDARPNHNWSLVNYFDRLASHHVIHPTIIMSMIMPAAA